MVERKAATSAVPPATTASVLDRSAELLASRTTPSCTVVAPVKELDPASTRVPAPAFTSPPAPAIGEAAFTVIVRPASAWNVPVPDASVRGSVSTVRSLPARLPTVPPVQRNDVFTTTVFVPVCAPRAMVPARSIPAERAIVPDTVLVALPVPVNVFSATETVVAVTTAAGFAIDSVPRPLKAPATPLVPEPRIRPTVIDPVVSVPAPIVKLDSMLPPRPVAVQFAWPITSQLTAASVVPDERSTVAVNAFRLAPLRWLTVPTDHVPTGPLPLVPRSTSVGDVVPGANCRSESARLGLIATEPTFRTFVCPRKSCAPPASLSPLMSPTPSVPATIVLLVASVSDEVPGAPSLPLLPFNPTRNTPAGTV